ncbi:unnamed protein product [Knipowitschia caucasica]
MASLKLLLTLALALAPHINSVEGISCFSCTGSCASQKPQKCPDGETCISVKTIVNKNGVVNFESYKGCAGTSLCPSPGPKNFSINFGTESVLGRAECCDENNCNGAEASSPEIPGPGSLQCFRCDPLTNNCNTSLNCSVLETGCFQSTCTVILHDTFVLAQELKEKQGRSIFTL